MTKLDCHRVIDGIGSCHGGTLAVARLRRRRGTAAAICGCRFLNAHLPGGRFTENPEGKGNLSADPEGEVPFLPTRSGSENLKKLPQRPGNPFHDLLRSLWRQVVDVRAEFLVIHFEQLIDRWLRRALPPPSDRDREAAAPALSACPGQRHTAALPPEVHDAQPAELRRRRSRSCCWLLLSLLPIWGSPTACPRMPHDRLCRALAGLQGLIHQPLFFGVELRDHPADLFLREALIRVGHVLFEQVIAQLDQPAVLEKLIGASARKSAALFRL